MYFSGELCRAKFYSGCFFFARVNLLVVGSCGILRVFRTIIFGFICENHPSDGMNFKLKQISLFIMITFRMPSYVIFDSFQLTNLSAAVEQLMSLLI